MRYTRYYVILLLLFYLVNGIIYLNRQSITFDEGGHLLFGVRVLRGSTSRVGEPYIMNSKMPVSALNAVPRAVEQLLHPHLKKTDNGVSDIMHGRYVTLFVSLLTGIYVFKWSREWYGDRAGLFSLFLFVCCPNCLAHAGLVTTDAYAVLLLLLVLYYLWKYLSLGRNRDFVLFCVLTGVAQLVKQSLFHLYVIIPLLLFCWWLASDRRPAIGWNGVIKLGGFLLINLLVINAGYYFQGFGTSLSAYPFQSDLFKSVQARFSFIGKVPLPLPFSFVQGLDMAKYQLQLGGGLPESSFANVTILGHSSTGGSFWYYYFVVCWFKTPIAVLCLLGWSLYYLGRQSFRSVVRNELFLLLPVIYFLILMDFFFTSQTNIRHILLIYPPLYIFCGILSRYLCNRREKAVLAALLLWYVISVLGYFGNYIPYTNEFIVDKKMAYKTVGADNLEMGQCGLFLQDYLHTHPQAFMATPTPRAGRQVISLQDYLDVWNGHRYDWISGFSPVGQIADDYLIFDIPAEKINR